MTGRGAGLGAVGLLASALVHVSAFWALAALLAPGPVPDQPNPASRLDIEAQDVPRSEARPMTPEADAATEGRREASSARQGEVATDRARPLDPVPQPLAAQSATAPPLGAITPRAETPAAAPQPQRLAAASPAAAPLAPAAARPPVMAAARPAAAIPTALAPPAPVTAATAPPGQPLPETRPEGPGLAATAPDAAPTPARPLPQRRQTAALAWSGEGSTDTPLAAASLAAIAAFTRPEDAGAGASELRDGIAAILASVPCARLQTEFSPETGQLEIRGHIPEDGLRGPVLAALQAQVGGSIPLSDRLLILPRPQCAALAGIAGIGLPQSTEQLTNPRVIGAAGHARTYTYAGGERLELELQAPDYPGYIYVDYFTADGMVLHLQPNEVVGLRLAAPKSAQFVGRPQADGAFLDITIGPPYGQEIAAAFASSVPLYEGLRPLQEPSAPYLDFLRRQVAAARARDPSFKGEWVYFFITTVPG